jgi:hypothetical protein
VRGKEFHGRVCSIEVERWRVENDEPFGFLAGNTVWSSSEEGVRDAFQSLEMGFKLGDTICDTMDDDSVLDATDKAHRATLDDAYITSAVPTTLDKAGRRSLGVFVVAYKNHRSANLKLTALAICARSSAIDRVNDAHFATSNGTSKVKELASRFGCKNIDWIKNAATTARLVNSDVTMLYKDSYQVSVIPNPAETMKDTAEGFLLSFFMVAAKVCAVFETTASPPLVIRLMEDRSKDPKDQYAFQDRE